MRNTYLCLEDFIDDIGAHDGRVVDRIEYQVCWIDP